MNYGKMNKVKGLGFLEREWMERTSDQIYKLAMDELNDHSPLWLTRVETGDCKEEGLKMLQTLVDYYSELYGRHSIFKRQINLKVNEDFSYDVYVMSYR